jgi:hypothetical protein
MHHPGLCFLGAGQARSAGFRGKLMWHSPRAGSASWEGDP